MTTKAQAEEAKVAISRKKEQVSSFFRRTAGTSGVMAAVTATLGLLGWIPALRALGRVHLDYIPMAPSTSMSFLLLGLILAIHVYRAFRGWAAALAMVFCTLVSVFGVLEVAGHFTGKDLNFEDAIVPAVGTLVLIPVARMSPLTGAAFFIGGISLMLLITRSYKPGQDKLSGHLAGALGGADVVISLTVILGYLYRTPLLYSSSTVPMALTTAMGFLFLGVGLTAAAGRTCVPIMVMTGASTRARLLRIFLPLTIIVIFFQDVLHRFIIDWMQINDALLIAMSVMLFVAVTSVVVSQVSRTLGNAIDFAEAERRCATEALRAANQQLQASEQQLRAANQQLQASEQQLRAANQQLEANNQQLRASQEEIRALAKFPSENPNPVLRIGKDGIVIYSNEAGLPLLRAWRAQVGRRLPEKWRKFTADVFSSGSSEDTEFEYGDCILSLTFAPVVDLGYVNVYALDITQRKQAEARYQDLYDNAPDMFVSVDAKTAKIIRCNQTLMTATGYNKEEIIGRPIFDMYHPDCMEDVQKAFNSFVTTGEVHDAELQLRRKDGSKIEVSLNVSGVRDEQGNILYSRSAWRDIGDRKQAEEERRAANQQLEASEQQLRAANQQLQASEQQLKAANQQLRADEQQLKAANQQLQASEQQLRAANQQLQASEQQLRAANNQLRAEVTERKSVEEKIKASLKEKEVLLKEIHHRVKNNMQLISSILNLQSKYVKDEQALAIFKNGQGRIRSMAFVHEKLYESEDLAKIDFAEYVRSITHYLFRLHEISPRIRLNVDIKDILLDVNTAIPCALIINELVSNSLKYAFPEGIEGEMCIQLSSDKDGKVTLIVEDNGIGFPKDLDFRKTESLGMQLIIMLVEQLEGTVELDKSKGTAFTITF